MQKPPQGSNLRRLFVLSERDFHFGLVIDVDGPTVDLAAWDMADSQLRVGCDISVEVSTKGTGGAFFQGPFLSKDIGQGEFLAVKVPCVDSSDCLFYGENGLFPEELVTDEVLNVHLSLFCHLLQPLAVLLI